MLLVVNNMFYLIDVICHLFRSMMI